MSIQKSAQRIANRFGIRLSRYTPRWPQMLVQRGVDLVVDAGANVGQYAQALRAGGYTDRILSIEPLSTAFEELDRRTQADRNWSAVNVAVGSEPGMTEINIAGNSVSSSILPMLDAHSESAPKSKYVGLEHVNVTTVDELLEGMDARAPFLKIDTQGFETAVLLGASASLKSRLIGVQLEMSLVPLYGGQELFDSLLHRLLDAEFELWSLEPGFADRRTGRLLQVDGIFFRT